MEKIIKREDGTRHKIIINMHLNGYGDAVTMEYRATVLMCKKGKRTWVHCTDMHDYEFRRLSMPERAIALHAGYLKHVTADEIYQAKLEAWEQLKPTR